jgi:hypothetical protein
MTIAYRSCDSYSGRQSGQDATVRHFDSALSAGKSLGVRIKIAYIYTARYIPRELFQARKSSITIFSRLKSTLHPQAFISKANRRRAQSFVKSGS